MSDVRAEEQTLLIHSSEDALAVQETAKTNTVWQFVKLILVLILVIACIYGIVWLLKKTNNPVFQSDPYLKKVASLNLAPGKSVYIVSTPSQAFLVGTADNSVNLIGEIKDKELIDTMNIAAEKVTPAKPRDFSTLLSTFLPKTVSKETELNEDFDDYFDSAAQNASAKLRQRREKIQNNDNAEDEK